MKAIIAAETAIPLNTGRYLLDSKDLLFAVTCLNSGITGIQSGLLDGLPRKVEGLPLYKVRMKIDQGSSGSPVFDDQGRLATIVNPNVAKSEGLQSQGAKGAAVVNLLQALGNAGSGALRLSPHRG